MLFEGKMRESSLKYEEKLHSWLRSRTTTPNTQVVPPKKLIKKMIKMFWNGRVKVLTLRKPTPRSWSCSVQENRLMSSYWKRLDAVIIPFVNVTFCIFCFCHVLRFCLVFSSAMSSPFSSVPSRLVISSTPFACVHYHQLHSLTNHPPQYLVSRFAICQILTLSHVKSELSLLPAPLLSSQVCHRHVTVHGLNSSYCFSCQSG